MPTTTTTTTTKRKIVRTEARSYLRTLAWDKLKLRLREHLQSTPGEQTRMARALGISDSQLHRYQCPHCEHDQEPTFSTGFAITLYLARMQYQPVIPLDPVSFSPKPKTTTTTTKHEHTT